MFAINFNLVSYSAASLGPTVTAVGSCGPGSTEALQELTIPWRPPQPNSHAFALLSWHAALSRFAGRDPAVAELHEWAVKDQAVSIKFITGEGGVGKSRLAAEFASQLLGQNWAAGFASLRKPQTFPMHRAGTLLIVDYPEEHPAGLAEMLRDLAELGLGLRLRVLVLSRRPFDEWTDTVYDNHAAELVDQRPMVLDHLDEEAAYTLFESTQEAAAQALDATPLPLSQEALSDWLAQAPEHSRALFLVALAVHSAYHPSDEIVSYTGPQIIEALVEREATRLRRSARRAGLTDPDELAHWLVLASIAPELPASRLTELAARAELALDPSAAPARATALREGGWIADGQVVAVYPDLVAAAFAVHILGRQPERATEWLWAALQLDLASGLSRLGRLSHDAEYALGLAEYRLSGWLAEAVEGKPDRCAVLDEHINVDHMSLGWLEAAIAVGNTLLKVTMDEHERARLLSNLSNRLSDTGQAPAALESIREAVDIHRQLAQRLPDRFLPDLALSLNNLSNRLGATGQAPAALESIQEAVDIHRHLAQRQPDRFLPDLATSLNNLSVQLGATGQAPAALESIQEAVDIHRHLAQRQPDRFLPDLATSLNNLSVQLGATGQAPAALESIQEAVDIRRHLAQRQPDRFLPDLATSLNNLSVRLGATGQAPAALESIQEAVDMRRHLAQRQPDRFLPDLATSLNNLSNRLGDTGQAWADEFGMKSDILSQ